mgnify:FL=1
MSQHDEVNYQGPNESMVHTCNHSGRHLDQHVDTSASSDANPPVDHLQMSGNSEKSPLRNQSSPRRVRYVYKFDEVIINV